MPELPAPVADRSGAVRAVVPQGRPRTRSSPRLDAGGCWQSSGDRYLSLKSAEVVEPSAAVMVTL